MSQATHQGFNLVGGLRRTTDLLYEVRNPAAIATVVGTSYSADPKLVDEAVTAAATAQAEWRATKVSERAEVVAAAQVAVVAQSASGEWAALLTAEQGKAAFESAFEVFSTQLFADCYLRKVVEALTTEDTTEPGVGRLVASYDPIGVTVGISPWNYPVALSLNKVIPAILAGNAIVLKPAPNTPFTVTEVLAIFAAQLPPGVVNVVHGGAAVGEQLCTDHRVRKISFTGSTPTGRRVAALAAQGVKNVTLELGGNDPAIVLDDAELTDDVISRMVTAIFLTTGQVCMAIKRIYVHQSRYHELVDKLATAADAYVVGDGANPEVTMGPLNNEASLEKVRGLAAEAKASGGTVTTIGQVAPGTDWEAGYFVRPAVVTGVDDRASLVTEEQFGPIIPILQFEEDSDAIRRANNSEFGLCASVWSSDDRRAFEVGQAMEAGIVFVNNHGVTALDTGRGGGGIKQSGIGKEFGLEGLREYTNARYVSERVFQF